MTNQSVAGNRKKKDIAKKNREVDKSCDRPRPEVTQYIEEGVALMKSLTLKSKRITDDTADKGKHIGQ